MTAEFKIETFDNKEILVIYHRFAKYITEMESNLEKGIVVKKVNTPMGFANAISQVTDEEAKAFVTSEYFLTIKSLVEKLKPIADLIESCSEELQEFSHKIN